MAKGYILNTNPAAFNATGNSDIPCYIDADGIPQVCKSIDDSLLTESVAAEAQKLNIARQINGTNFDGTKNITTSYWGTARTITITDADGSHSGTSLSVDGSKNITIKLPTTIKADTTGIAENAEYAQSAGTSSKVTVNNATDATKYYIIGASGTGAGSKNLYNAYNASGSKNKTGIYFQGNTGTLMGAAWNDYAETRLCQVPAGFCVVENGTGQLVKSTKRLQKAPNLVSDTCGMVIGPEGTNYSTIAVAGRSLAYTDEHLKVGDVVCSGKDGKVSKMSRLEIILFPDRIVGTVSEIPAYKKWNDVIINNRIWIKVK